MAQTRESIYANGKVATRDTKNPYKEGSWQFNAWRDGHDQARALCSAFERPKAEKSASVEQPVRLSVAAPLGISTENMPKPTIEHVRLLSIQRMHETDQKRLKRLNAKIEKLERRYAV